MNNRYSLINRPEGLEKLLELTNKVDKNNPTPSDIQALKNWIKENPEIFQQFRVLSNSLHARLIDKIQHSRGSRIVLRGEIEFMAMNLCWEDCAPLEQLIIDNIMSSWLWQKWVEIRHSQLLEENEVNIKEWKFWDERLSAAQRRFLRSCETFARIRKLAKYSPSLQVNIASDKGQQVNIQGEDRKENSYLPYTK